MTRVYVLATLVIAGAVSVAARGYQQPPANAPKVIEVDKVKDNLFVLKGGGGNTAVFVTSNGVVVVDAKNPGWGQPILDKIKELTNKPVTTLINTHTHGDHVSGNVEFPASVDVIVQENTKANMEKMDIFKQNNGKGLPKWPAYEAKTNYQRMNINVVSKVETDTDRPAYLVLDSIPPSPNGGRGGR